MRKEDFLITIKRNARVFARFTHYILTRISEDRVFRVAASLSYTSMIALIPFITIAVVVFAAFPVFSDVRGQMQDFILSNFLPQTGDILQDKIGSFVEATGKLTAVGTAGLVVTAIMLLATIEAAFNAIFRVTRPRAVFARIIVYWSALTLGPLILGGSFSLSGYLFALKTYIAPDSFMADSFIAFSMPIILLAVGFSFLYLTLPYRPVRIRDALIGGIVSAILFSLLKSGFGLFATNATTYKTLYGALATLPLFLIWMYLSWAVILIGAVVTAAFPEWKGEIRYPDTIVTPAQKIAISLDFLSLLQKGSSKAGGLTRGQVLKGTGASEAALMPIMRLLRDNRFIERTERKKWVLIHSLEQATLHQLFALLEIGFHLDDTAPHSDYWKGDLKNRLTKLAETEKDILDVSIASLLPTPKKV